MIRASLFGFCCFISITGLSIAFEDMTTVPVCENKSPHDIYFDLSNMGLDAIRKPFVSGPSVTCVNLSGNKIVHLEKGAFDGLPQLDYLNLGRNPVSFEDFMNMTFPKLSALVLDDGPFDYSYDNRGEHDPSSNYYAYYYGNDNHRLGTITPIFLPQLKKLSLCNYRDENRVLTWLKYFNVPNLTHLYITGNRFTQTNLPRNFTDKLTHLNMSNNELSIFATNLPKLRYLSIDQNNIMTVCNSYCSANSLSLRDMPEVEYLSLMGNIISDIQSDAFQDLDNLRFLNLAKNRIQYLPSDLFNDMTSLKNLSLAQNTLTEIPNICGLRHLEILILNENNINSINEISFCNLLNLRSIDLSHNALTTVSDGTFGLLSGLMVLDISWNRIAALPQHWMGSEHTLNILNLDGNLFNDVANMSLELIEKLDTISIGHNPLRMVSIHSLVTLPPDMKIDVSRVYKE